MISLEPSGRLWTTLKASHKSQKSQKKTESSGFFWLFLFFLFFCLKPEKARKKQNLAFSGFCDFKVDSVR